MCGIAGFIGGDWRGSAEAAAVLRRMAESISYRGPDRTDFWIDRDSRVAFAHNRLAIIDLSEAGNQPMQSHSGRFVIIFNGEIYNHQEIREELTAAGRAPNWNGHSDTETLLAAVEAWGVRGALERSEGMFALALWDKAERCLVLARDRLGEKPLYYGRQRVGGPFLFGSDLKALAQHPQYEREVDRDALTLLLRYNYIPAPHSIHKGIKKLLPGTLLRLRAASDSPEVETYWSAAEVAVSGQANPIELGDDDAVDELERRLEGAVARQMMADVPLGAFLSGGVDSSTIVALMQNHSSRPVKTFSIGFHEQEYNEANYAKAVARYLKTEHTELYLSAEQARDVIPRLPEIYTEPFADSSQIPTHLVSSLAREHVTVSLSGDGGDEVLGGYNRYLYTSELWNKLSSVPRGVRIAAAKGMTAVPPAAWTKVGNSVGKLLPKLARADRLGDMVHKGARLLASETTDDVYSGAVSLWPDPEEAVIGGTEPPNFATGAVPSLPGLNPIERMMALDMMSYLPDDILAKVDRAAMAVSLETRVPYLSHRIVEFAWRLPLNVKIRGGETKWILRRLLYRHVSKELIERPKAGFGIPLGKWLRGPLRDWAEDLLDERRLREEGYFDPKPIRRLWEAHLRGTRNEEHRLWGVLMFQSWLETAAAPSYHEPIRSQPTRSVRALSRG